MIKKVLTLFLGIMLVTGLGSASPLTDYSAGRVAVDLSFFPNVDFTESIPFNGAVYDAKGTKNPLEVGITVGLGGKWAVQYRQFHLDTKEGTLTSHGSLIPLVQKHQEFNLLYQLQKNLSVFVGKHRYSGHTNDPDYYYALKGSNNIQVGLVGTKPIGDKLSAFALIARGSNKLEKYEVGLSYGLSPQLDINLLYQYQNMKIDDGGIRGRQKGVGYGLTYKF